MTTQNESCEYEYEHFTEVEPSGIAEFHRPDKTVQCPHEVPLDDVDTCLFHGVDEEYPREKATESFLNALSENPDASCFAGAYLPWT